MDLSLTHEQNSLYDEVLEFAQSNLNANIDGRDRAGAFSNELWAQCGKQGLPGLPVPITNGGRDLDALSCALAYEALGYGCRDNGLTFSLGAHLSTVVVPLWKYGTDQQKERFLTTLSDGSVIASAAATELETGSDTFAMRTSARREGSHFILNGKKHYVTNIPEASLAIVYAYTDRERRFLGGLTAFLVSLNSPGVNVSGPVAKLGLRTSPLGMIELFDVVVPEDAVVGGVGGGARVFQTAMNWERALLMASHVGTMRRTLEEAIEYARTRSQSGRPIGKFQAVSHRLVDSKVSLEAARLLVFRAASNLDSPDAMLTSAIAKLFVSEAYVEATMTAIRTRGAAGYVESNETERFVRDSIGATIYSGTSDIQRNIISSWLGM